MRVSSTAAVVALVTAFVSPRLHAEPNANQCSVAYARGQEERLSGRLFSARQAFLQCSSAQCPASISADCAHWASEVEQDLPTVRIRVSNESGQSMADLQVFADGVSVPPAALSAPVILEAGPHELRFEAAGYETIQVEIALRPTDREVQVVAVLRPPKPRAAPAKPSTHRPVPTLSVVLAGVSALALGGALYFGVRAHDQYRDLKHACAPNCNPTDANSMYDKAVISDVALAASVVALGASAWFYFNRDSDAEPSTAVGVQARAGGAQLGLRTAF